MIQRSLCVGPFQCNCQILVCPRTGEGIIIDPGDEASRILAELNHLKVPSGESVQIKYLLHTHGHLDHIGATRSLKEGIRENSPRIALHPGDRDLYLNLKLQGQLFGFQYADPLAMDYALQDEEILCVGDLKLTVLHTPGHSPGSVCFRLHESSGERTIPEMLFSGDTLFQGSVGRTDLWGANQDQMFKSIRQRLLVLDDDTRVCPGHGSDTRIGIEKRTNPFLQ